MPASGPSPLLSRALLVLALYTLASWAVIAAVLLAWAPGRSVAANAVAHVARAAASMPAAAPLAAFAVSDLAPSCDLRYHVSAADETGAGDFSWSLRDRDGYAWSYSDDGEGLSRRGRGDEPSFWFRDHGDEYVVHDPALVAEVREAARPLRELGAEMGRVGAEMGRHGAHMGRIGGRMGVAGARLALLEARLARRAASRAAREQAEASLRELRAEMEALRDQLGDEHSGHERDQRELSRRMAELSARHREVMREVREKVREIATRARRQGKAERPHASA